MSALRVLCYGELSARQHGTWQILQEEGKKHCPSQAEATDLLQWHKSWGPVVMPTWSGVLQPQVSL
jgi:hypothetical protein